jgi:hypothetical protein
MKQKRYNTTSHLGLWLPVWGDFNLTDMNVLTVKTKWAIGTITIGSGNKKLELDKTNKYYQFM